MLKRVILESVIGRWPVDAFSKNNGITDPLDPITLPYLTQEKLIFLSPLILFPAMKSLSDTSFVAP